MRHNVVGKNKTFINYEKKILIVNLFELLLCLNKKDKLLQLLQNKVYSIDNYYSIFI